MTRSFRLISSYFILVLALSSCSSKLVLTESGCSPLLGIGSEMQKLNMQLSFKKKSFSGMLIIQRRADCEIRIVASTFFGPTLFDFGLKDGQFIVYSCIEPLRDKRIAKLFENDFKKLLLPNQKFRKTTAYTEYKEYVTGRNFGKSIFKIYKSQDSNFKKLTVRHPLIGVNISFESL